MSSGFESARSAPPEERRGDAPENARWRRGFDDGQRLVYNISLLERLDPCYVPVPAVPGEDWVTDEVSAVGPPGSAPR